MPGQEIVLHSLKFRGTAQPVRELLSLLGLPFKDHHYASGKQLAKTTAGLKKYNPTPGLVFCQGEVVLTHPVSICQHLLRQHDERGLIGKSLKEQLWIQNVLALVLDLWNYTQNQLAEHAEFRPDKPLNMLPKHHYKANELLQLLDSRVYIANSLSVADLFLAEFLSLAGRVFGVAYSRDSYVAKVKGEVKDYYRRPDKIEQPYSAHGLI